MTGYATIVDVAYTGANTLYVLESVAGMRLVATRLNEELPGQDLGLEAGDRVLATFRKEHVAKIPTNK
jgi:putative spermidine/putrescine transport system ATP-binding protein